MAKIEFDTDKFDLVVADAGEITISPDGEKVLLDFFRFKDQMLVIEAVIKEKLNEKMAEMSPGQKSINGDHIRITRKISYESGKKYAITPETPAEFLKKLVRTYENPATDKIESYLKENGELPAGVTANEMKHQIEIKVVE